ncbi:protein chibby homolog 1-like [Bombina bombina]|uniref:protein chibby homolog 1-like n=1 Tax=Bombina bombina TaxID=8345 RepID=UPI00235A794C|nr:protein chibby homolog 1-like [Bombina bombina]
MDTFGPFIIQTCFSTDRFNPKKSYPRKFIPMSSLYLLNDWSKYGLGLDYGPPEINLDNKIYAFYNGSWVIEGDSQCAPKASIAHNRLLARNKTLIKEKNCLKLQMEILIDMLAETTIKLAAAEEKLRKMSIHKKEAHMDQSQQQSH